MRSKRVSIVPPGDQKVIVQDVTFELEAGHGLGVIGPSGSGKSSLVRALVGVWQPFRGKVRLDGAALDQWSSDVLGQHIGYLPQDVELFAGTVAQNICRFDPDANSEAIIAAAKEAGVHQMIIKMREGYDTQIGEQGTSLSAGQAQRVALARALYGDPFLIVLDEPNSNLDTEGDEALTRAVRAARERGAIVVVVAHRPIGIEAVDQLLVLRDGRMQAFGPKETVLGQVLQRVAPPPPIKIVSDGGSCQIMIKQSGDARESIRLHLIVGLTVVVLLAGGLGGWASTAEISGALIAPGQIVVEFERQEGAAPDRRRGRRGARARRRPRQGRRRAGATRRYRHQGEPRHRHQDARRICGRGPRGSKPSSRGSTRSRFRARCSTAPTTPTSRTSWQTRANCSKSAPPAGAGRRRSCASASCS